ncbi:MAG: tyrosine-type recombinase/integrase, partial [Pseudomonadota bacterium]
STDALNVLSRADAMGRYVFNRRNCRKHFEAGLCSAGIEEFRWHDLRHTHATWLRQAGAPVEVVQRSLGHAAIGTTMRYAHVADTELQNSLQQLPTLSPTTGGILKFPVKKQLRKS